MLRIYVAGAYSADNVIDVLKNIGRGQDYAAKLFMLGHAPFCPWHDKEYVIQNWDKDFNVKMFYDYSMKWLEVSDVVFLVPGWENSKGTQKEIERAVELDIPVVKSIDELEKIERIVDGY